MKKVGEMVAKLGKVALVWDDMLRTVPLSDIKVNRIDNLQPKEEFIKKMLWSSCNRKPNS